MATADSIFKFCKKCQVWTERYARGRCKPCKKASDAARHAANPDRHRENVAAWSAANPARKKATAAAWVAANLDRVKANKADAYAANPERMKAVSVAWRAANPEATRIHHQNYHAKKRANGGLLSKGLSVKLFKLQRGLCPCCNQPLGKDFHLDHIEAISTGGQNIDSNMQLLRKVCNLKKSAKHQIDFMQSRGFLL